MGRDCDLTLEEIESRQMLFSPFSEDRLNGNDKNGQVLTDSERQEIKTALIGFVKRVSSGAENKTSAEVRILPEILRYLNFETH